MAQHKPSINLLPHKGEGFITQFLNWSLTIGRLLIILTETAALATFLYRFGLDMQIVDLHDKIKAQSFIVKNFKDSEETFRNMQDRIALAKKYDSSSMTTPKVFTDVANMGKGKVTFNSIIASTDTVIIEAQAQSADVLSEFVEELKKYPPVKSISVNSIKNSTANALVTVGMTAYLQTEKGPQTKTQQANPGQSDTIN